nr:poly [ADP-ribose] polymerase tankyrase-1-like [Procambarus clarkii]
MSSNGRQPMLEGAARGSKTTVKSQLSVGINVNEKSNRKDDNGRTALHLSAEAGHLEVVVELVRNQARVDAKDSDGIQPLHLAAGSNHLQVLRHLLHHGASLEAEDDRGRRAVHYAAASGHKMLLEEMRKQGCDLEAVARDGSSPLHLAAENNQLQVVQWLLQQGVDASSKNLQQEAAEDCARRKSHSEVAQFLQERRTSPSTQQGGRDQVHAVGNLAANASAGAHGSIRPLCQPDTQLQPLGSREGSNLSQPSRQPYPQPSYQPNPQMMNSPQPYPDFQHLPEASAPSQHLPQASASSQHLPQSSPHFQHLPKASAPSQHLPQSSPHFQHLPEASAPSQHLPQSSPHFQHLPEASAPSQHLPQSSPHFQHLPQASAPSQHWPQASPHFQHLPEASAPSQHLPQTSPHPQHLPQSSLHFQHLPQASASPQHLPQSSPHSQHLPEAFAPSQHLPQASLYSQHLPQGSPHPSPQTPLSNRDAHDPSVRLLVAASEGRADEVDSLVVSGADPSFVSSKPGEEGLQAIHLACWGGHTEVVKKLLEHSVDPRAVAAGREGVHWAAFGGHVTVLRLLKERGCDVTAASTPDGSTPLHLAADNGNLDATRWLVEQGAQIDAKDNNGNTPSDLAMVSEASDVYNYLDDRLKEEQLVEAAGAGNFELTRRLIQDEVFVDAPSHKPQIRGRRALHQAADGGYTALVEDLLQAGADPTADDNEGVLAVHLAAQAGHLEVLKLLLLHLPHGTAEVKGEKLVHWASKGGHVKILHYLKTTKCNLRATTKGTRRTALHLAADNGNLDAVKWLVEQGLSLDHRDADGFTAKDLAEHEGHREVELYLQQVLVPQRPKTTPQESKFLHAAANGKLPTVVELLDAKVNVDCKDQQGRSAVQLACAAGYLQVVKLLVARGAQLNDHDDEGNTATHLAAEGGHLAILRVLRDNQCDLSSINNEDDSPLHFAARSSKLHVIKWLLDQGVEANETNAQGYTAEDIAREKKCMEAVSMLTAHTKASGVRNLSTLDPQAKTHKRQQSSKDRSPTRPQSEEYTMRKSPRDYIPMPIGLKSIGNTCYMNSVIQCLYSTSCLTYYILHGHWREDINKESEYGGEVADAFHDVIYQLDSRGETLAPVKALKTILGEHEVIFKGKEQQDAHDFYSLLLHALDTDLQGRGPSHIAELFIGHHKSDIVCEKTKTIISSVDELFSSLTLTVGSQKNSKHHCTLEELLTQYYRSCSIEWECPTCDTIHDCVRTTRIHRLPKILVIHLSRVNQASGRSQSDRKQIVKFGKRLHTLDAFHVGTFRGEYSLYAVCSHLGTATNGHYISTCRDWRLKSVWREFDDEIVTQLKGNCPVHDERKYAHMLFYENLES